MSRKSKAERRRRHQAACAKIQDTGWDHLPESERPAWAPHSLTRVHLIGQVRWNRWTMSGVHFYGRDRHIDFLHIMSRSVLVLAPSRQ